MTYLKDPWVWLSAMLPFGLVSIFGPVTRRILRYAREHPELSTRVNIIKTSFALGVIIAMGTSLLFFQWLAGRRDGEPYKAAFAFACLPAFVLDAWIVTRTERPDSG
jgi:hypothetical protein